ncbi:5,10-methenyltetrahydrofolate synthetase [Synechococcus sp. PCC 7502]|uniref:5-formyltetrahydrofolate cyclo-ligase n=1 Tax=Synechococcus sp. PCC 7502 TaxID=1173263 RepID=UPI00029FCA17|nr:5-formyltetrahydrofolate cyclo-ligase [Synechococcus sp. PCC 7502]AFY73399.1 5,10-methenyltetrahydrofolate synthetase [Synechococcus sp. PCC 7502]
MQINPKIELRRELLSKRRSLSKLAWQQQSQKICNHLAASELVQNAEVILGFISFRQEPDLSHLWQQFPRKVWGFPKCLNQNKNLDWYQIRPDRFPESTEVGKFDILEPKPDLPRINLDHVDLILVPAIAIDRKGYRLGYGGGFYDRFLVIQTSFTIGVVFADFYLETLPNQAWDLPIQAVCTEKGIDRIT